MPIEVKCQSCGKTQQVIPARAKTYKFCSYRCRGDWRKLNWTGENNPSWVGGSRVKACLHCGGEFSSNKTEAISTFNRRKFCSKPCADKGGFRAKGEAHHNYRKDARRRNRGGPHRKWATAVINRDKAICQKCGKTNIELHAHHIKSYQDYPDLRFDIDNGMTLCFECHWNIHTAQNDNGVNSGEAQTVKAVGDPDPSLNGNILEGVTTRGRAYRRWTGSCSYCGCFISKRLSDIKNKSFLYCSHSCASKHRYETGIAFKSLRQ